MSVNEPMFPSSIWDGLSPERSSRLIDRPPTSEDWDQIVAEMIATQLQLSRFNSVKIVEDSEYVPFATDRTIYFTHSDCTINLDGVYPNGFDLYLRAENQISVNTEESFDTSDTLIVVEAGETLHIQYFNGVWYILNHYIPSGS